VCPREVYGVAVWCELLGFGVWFALYTSSDIGIARTSECV